MIKSIYFMFLYVPACSDYLHAVQRRKTNSRICLLMISKSLYKMKTYRE